MIIKAICKNNSANNKIIDVYVNSQNIVEIYPTMFPELSSSYQSPIFYQGKKYFYITTNSYPKTGCLYISEDDFNLLFNQNSLGNASK